MSLQDCAVEATKALAIDLLRERVARIEGVHLHRLDAGTGPAVQAGAGAGASVPDQARVRPVRPLGIAAADAALSGGFPAAGLTEIHVEETRGAGVGAGFVLSLAVIFAACAGRPALWIGDGFAFSEAGMPYLPGLIGHGLDPSGLLLVRTRRLEEALWAGEEAARSAALSLVILEVRGNPGRLSLEGTRRLHFRARETGLPLVLLRQKGQAEPTAAPFRLRIGPEPAAAVPGLCETVLIGHPVFRVAVEKSPDGRPHEMLLEWNPDERRFQTPRARAAQPHHGRFAVVSGDGPDPAREPRQVVALKRAS